MRRRVNSVSLSKFPGSKASVVPAFPVAREKRRTCQVAGSIARGITDGVADGIADAGVRFAVRDGLGADGGQAHGRDSRVSACRLGASEGFTLTEMLACVVLVGLVSLCLATGVQFASKSYDRSLALSEAQTLSSTLTCAVEDEVRFAQPVTVSHKKGEDTVEYVSSTFGAYQGKLEDLGGFDAIKAGGLVLDTGQDGRLRVNGHELLATSVYPKNTRACADTFTFDEATRTFAVKISIWRDVGSDSDTPLATTSFEVRPLNG